MTTDPSTVPETGSNPAHTPSPKTPFSGLKYANFEALKASIYQANPLMQAIAKKKGKVTMPVVAKKGKTQVGLTCRGVDYVLGVPHAVACCPLCHNQGEVAVKAGGAIHRLQFISLVYGPLTCDGITRPEKTAHVCCMYVKLIQGIQVAGGWDAKRRKLMGASKKTAQPLPPEAVPKKPDDMKSWAFAGLSDVITMTSSITKGQAGPEGMKAKKKPPNPFDDDDDYFPDDDDYEEEDEF